MAIVSIMPIGFVFFPWDPQPVNPAIDRAGVGSRRHSQPQFRPFQDGARGRCGDISEPEKCHRERRLVVLGEQKLAGIAEIEVRRALADVSILCAGVPVEALL